MAEIIPTQLLRVRDRLEILRIPTGTFAQICGITPSALSQGLRGVYRISNETEKVLSETSSLLLAVSEAIAPLRLPAEPDDLLRVLTFVREKNIAPEKIRAAINGVFGSRD